MLAIRGGEPIRKGGWASWPRSNEETEKKVLEILRSGRWTISGPHVPSPLAEREFARQFAAYNGVRHCVPTANGSSALVIALEALDIGPGDEVIVPVLTWVATAAAVLRVNATPVFVDVDAGTLCLAVPAARAATTSRTREGNGQVSFADASRIEQDQVCIADGLQRSARSVAGKPCG